MAPSRLPRKGLDMGHLCGWRWWLIRRTPTVLIDYLFEVLLAAAGYVTAGAYFAGLTARGAVIQLLPGWLAALYGVLLLVASITVTFGLAIRHYGTVVVAGLRAMVVACFVYALSADHYVGLRALTPEVMSLVLAAFAAWRAFILHSTYLYLIHLAEAGEDEEGASGSPG
jgi:hypothetical protein